MQVYAHDPSSASTLQSALKSTLPHSINLVYRTQHANRTEHAYLVATFPPWTCLDKVPKCWAAAYLDRSMRPETELWMFGTLELPLHQQQQQSSSELRDNHHHQQQHQQYCSQCKKAILALVDYMATLPTPPIRADNLHAMNLARKHEKEYPTPPPSGVYETWPGTYMRHLLLPKAVTLGACQRDVLQVLQEAGLVRTELPGPGAELNKFLFRLSDLPEPPELPDGLLWGEVREQDIGIVQSRTSIPRTASTLMSLKSVSVFEKETNTPVAWTFLGLDGSLVTLHTEEAYRGRGIAKAVAVRLLKKHAVGLAVDNDGHAWSHADVYMGNVQSERVCRSLGGVAYWTCFWLRIDLDRAGTLASTS